MQSQRQLYTSLRSDPLCSSFAPGFAGNDLELVHQGRANVSVSPIGMAAASESARRVQLGDEIVILTSDQQRYVGFAVRGK